MKHPGRPSPQHQALMTTTNVTKTDVTKTDVTKTDMTKTDMKGARQRIDPRHGSSDPFAHLQSSGLQDGQPLLRPLPSRLTGETSRRHRPAGGLQMSERHCDGVR
jgi:hypothetical protein